MEVFSAWFSFTLYIHFGLSHIASVMFGDVSNANLKYFMESIGIGFLTELGCLFALNFFSFFVWVIFTMIALISENSHWVVWLISSAGIGFAAWFTVHFVATVMARSGLDSHLYFAPYYLRLEVHSGLFSNEGLQLESDLSRESLLEKLSERAMQDLEGTKTKIAQSRNNDEIKTNTSHVDRDSDPGDSEDSEQPGSDNERNLSEMALEVAVWRRQRFLASGFASEWPTWSQDTVQRWAEVWNVCGSQIFPFEHCWHHSAGGSLSFWDGFRNACVSLQRTISKKSSKVSCEMCFQKQTRTCVDMFICVPYSRTRLKSWSCAPLQLAKKADMVQQRLASGHCFLDHWMWRTWYLDSLSLSMLNLESKWFLTIYDSTRSGRSGRSWPILWSNAWRTCTLLALSTEEVCQLRDVKSQEVEA